MDVELLQRYDARVPRYTSYPTAPNFHDGVDAATYGEWLARVDGAAAASLYFHVPFCQRMCWYCGCHTRVASRYRPVGDYAAVLAQEVALVAGAMAARPSVTHVHWGGGTPTMLSAADFAMLMAAARAEFPFDRHAEIAVEIDPRTLDDEKLAALSAAGVTRASLGVQDFNRPVQEAINRLQPFDMTADAVARLRDAGVAAINFDLMYGLPHQTTDDIIRTVDLAASLAPDRFAVFGYAHVPWMKTHQRMIDEAALPGAQERFDQSEAAAARLVEHGYVRIGLDHFARAGDAMAVALAGGTLRRNFQGYTTDRATALLGFGASAIGALDDGYVQNAVPLNRYMKTIRAGRLAVERGIALDSDDRLRRAVIERLMCDQSVDLDAMAAQYGGPGGGFTAEIAALAALRDDGLVELDGARVTITKAGRPLMRSVCAAFDRYLGAEGARHSRAV